MSGKREKVIQVVADEVEKHGKIQVGGKAVRAEIARRLREGGEVRDAAQLAYERLGAVGQDFASDGAWERHQLGEVFYALGDALGYDHARTALTGQEGERESCESDGCFKEAGHDGPHAERVPPSIPGDPNQTRADRMTMEETPPIGEPVDADPAPEEEPEGEEVYTYEDDCTCPHGDPNGIGAWKRVGREVTCPIHGTNEHADRPGPEDPDRGEPLATRLESVARMMERTGWGIDRDRADLRDAADRLRSRPSSGDGEAVVVGQECHFVGDKHPNSRRAVGFGERGEIPMCADCLAEYANARKPIDPSDMQVRGPDRAAPPEGEEQV